MKLIDKNASLKFDYERKEMITTILSPPIFKPSSVCSSFSPSSTPAATTVPEEKIERKRSKDFKAFLKALA